MSGKRFNTTTSNILNNLKLDEALKLAKRKIKSGDHEQAHSIYVSVLKKFPNNKIAKSQFDKLVTQLNPVVKVMKDPPRDQLDDLIAAYSKKDFRGTYLKAKKALETSLNNRFFGQNFGTQSEPVIIAKGEIAVNNDGELMYFPKYNKTIKGVTDLATIESYNNGIPLTEDFLFRFEIDLIVGLL